MDGLKRYLLANIEPSEFSSLVRNVLLNLGYFEINPIDGRNDHGVDIELFTFTFRDSHWVVQVSVQEASNKKVTETIQRLNTRMLRPIGIVYITNRRISNENRLKLQNYAYLQGYLLHVFDEQWMLARLDVDATSGQLVVHGGLGEEIELEGDTQQCLPSFLADVLVRVHCSLGSMDPRVLLRAYQALSACMRSFQLRQQGRVQKALSQSQEAYQLASALDNPLLVFLSSHLHGEVLKSIGRREDAARLFRECLAYSRQKNERTWEAVALTNLAETQLKVRDAVSMSVAATDIRQGLDLATEVGVSLGQQSKLALRLGDPDSALRLAEDSLQTMRSVPESSERGVARAHLHAASAHLAAGSLEDSMNRSREAERAFIDCRDRRTLIRARLVMIESILRSQSSFGDLEDLMLSVYRECIELADGEGLRELLRIIELYEWRRTD